MCTTQHLRPEPRFTAPIEPLEPRHLLASTPASLLTQFTTPYIHWAQDPVMLGQTLYFTVLHEGQNAESLFRSTDPDGGDAGTTTEIFSALFSHDDRLGITAPTIFKGRLYFFANGPQGDGLYRTDAAGAGVEAVRIFRTENRNVLPTDVVVFNDLLYFVWSDTSQAAALWATDGTTEGTSPVVSLPSAEYKSFSDPIDGHFFFSGGNRLFRSDGTASGTTFLWSGPDESSVAASFAVAGTKLFFSYEGVNTRALYVADRDGTDVAGVPSPFDPSRITTLRNNDLTVVSDGTKQRVVFTTRDIDHSDERLYATDGVEMIRITLPYQGVYQNELSQVLSAGDGKAVYIQRFGIESQSGLWVTDGTPAGTRQLLRFNMDVLSAPGVSDGQRGFFIRRDKDFGLWLYSSDGTPEGSRLNMFLEPARFNGVLVGAAGGRVFAQGTIEDPEPLWSFDGDLISGSVGGSIFYDLNGDGDRDGFETSGLNGNLYIDLNQNGVRDAADYVIPATENTPFSIEGLHAGHYTLRFDGLTPTTIASPPGGAFEIDLLPGQDLGSLLFGATLPNVVWGKLFLDADGDGVQDPDETGLGGQTVYLDYNNNYRRDPTTEPQTTTAPDGTYGFTSVTLGQVIVRRPDVLGWMQTTPTRLGGARVNLSSGSVAEAPSIGIIEAPAGAVSGYVWHDWNENGVLDFRDSPRSGVGVYVDRNDDGIFTNGEPTATTDAIGRYFISSVIPDQYTLRLRTLSAQQTAPAPANGIPVVIPPGETASAGDFLTRDPALQVPLVPTLDAGTLRITGGSGADSFQVARGTAPYTDRLFVTTAPGATFNYLLADVQRVEIATGGGNDSVRLGESPEASIDLGPGDDVFDYNGAFQMTGAVAAPVSFNGGGGADTLNILAGTFDADSDLSLTTDALTVNVRFNLDRNSRIRFDASQRLARLNIESGAGAVLTAGGDKSLFCDALVIAATGQLDLHDGSLLVAGGANPGAVRDTLQNYVRVMRKNGAWDGAGGILSSNARADLSALTGLAVRLTPEGILVRYTWAADADADRRITPDDYFLIDRGFLARRDDFADGDFDYDKVIDLDDYAILDRAYLTQPTR